MSESSPEQGNTGSIQQSFKGRIGTPGAQDVNDFHGRSDIDSSVFAQHHTLGMRRNQASRGDHDHDGVNSKRISSMLTKFLVAEQSFTVNSTLVDITGWSIPVEANSLYRFDMYLIGRTSAVGDLFASLGFTLPAGATVNYTTNHMSSGSSEASINRIALTSTAFVGTPAIGIDSLTDVVILPSGMINIGATAGNVVFRFAKSSGTGNVLLQPLSSVRMHKVTN